MTTTATAAEITPAATMPPRNIPRVMPTNTIGVGVGSCIITGGHASGCVVYGVGATTCVGVGVGECITPGAAACGAGAGGSAGSTSSSGLERACSTNLSILDAMSQPS